MVEVLGIDGGGTKTVCVRLQVRDDGGEGGVAWEVVGRGVTGCSNVNSVGAEAACAALQRAIRLAMRRTDGEAEEQDEQGEQRQEGLREGEEGELPLIEGVAAVGAGLAGVDRPGDDERVKGWLRPLFRDPAPLFSIHNDALAALAAGTEGRLPNACVLIAGTGTVALGVGKDGSRARASGWGPGFGDAGSGYALGNAALEAVARAHDGRGRPAERLTRAVLSELGLEKPEDLIGWRYADTSWARVAALAPVVLALCNDGGGDAEAQNIAEDGARELATSAKAVALRLGLGEEGESTVPSGEFPLVLEGGLLAQGGKMARMVTFELQHMVPRARIVHPKASVEAAVGAALLAYNQLTAAG
eukprot:jgi/Chlat1/4690/Chrsp3S05622